MISKIANYRRRFHVMLNTFIDNSKYLVPGEYFINTELNYLYRGDSETTDFLKRVTNTNNDNRLLIQSIKKYCKKILVPTKILISENKKNSDFKGSIYLLSNHNSDIRDAKIFNLNHNQILTIYASLDSLQKKISYNDYFGYYFRTPKILTVDYDKKFSIEELVLSKPKRLWSFFDYQIVIENIFKSYRNYYMESAGKQVHKPGYLSSLIRKLKSDELLQDIAGKIENEIPQTLITDNIPIMKQHGDLWLRNTLLGDNGDIYFIDWEYAGEYFLFYDLFYWMLCEWTDNSDFSYIYNFMNGKYDACFEDIFQPFNYKYDRQYCKSYFYIFILEILYHRVLPETDLIKITANSLYLKIFHYIQEL